MGIRCLIGHDYGEPQTEEDREERGDDVVVTVQEFETCNRCGHRRILSENTEVRRTATPEDASTAGDPVGDDQSQWSDPQQTSDPVETEETPVATGGAGTGGDSSEFEDVSAEEDDGVILEDDEETPEREHGQWPEEDDPEEAHADYEEWPDDHEPTDDPGEEHEEWPDDHEPADGAGEYEDWPDDADQEADDADADHEAWPDDHGERTEDGSSEQTDWPTVKGDDEGFDAEHSAGGPDGSVDFGGGLTPERSGESADGTDETIEAAGGSPGGSTETQSSGSRGSDDGESAAGIRRAEPGPSPTSQQRSADPDATFVCPRCGHTAPAHGSSLRPGDICPECQLGYLTEE